MMNVLLKGMANVGKPHARLDEEKVAPVKSRRGDLLCSVKTLLMMFSVLGSWMAGAYDWTGRSGTVTLAESAEVKDADLEVVTNLTGIVLADGAVDLIFNNATIPAMMKGTITGAGRIVKRGAAAVWFAQPNTTAKSTNSGWSNCYQDNYTANGILVEQGDLWFPQLATNPACYGPVTVNAGATVHIHTNKMTAVNALNGAGKVSNGLKWTYLDSSDHAIEFFIGYYGDTHVSDFTGTFEGNFNVRAVGNVRIHGADTDRAAMMTYIYRNDYKSAEDHGILRVSKFGRRPPYALRYKSNDTADFSAYASPLGIGSSYYYGVDYDLNYSGILVYEGTGETTDKIFRFGGSYNMAFDTLDMGATGGVTFSGKFRTYKTTEFETVVLRGSNTLETTFAGEIAGGDGALQFIKSGTGTWNWQPTSGSTSLAGAWFVVNGTLKFPTLADIGSDCALGMATNCTKSKAYAAWPDYWNAETNRLDCEIALGDWDKDGTNMPTLAYTGTSAASSNRRIGLMGAGGTIATMDAAGSLKLTGAISPRTPAQLSYVTKLTAPRAMTLGLAAAGGTNEIQSLSENDAGTVGLVKTGVGTWLIRNDMALHGAIDVREGTLAFNPKGLAPYTWFRYTVEQVNTKDDSGNNQYLWQRQLGLFDKDGNRLAQNLAFIGPDEATYSTWHQYTGNYDWTALQPGQVTMGYYNMGNGLIIYKGSTPANLFADSTSYMRVALPGYCRLDNARFWVPIVFRLPAGSAPVKYFDIVQHINCSVGDHVAAFKLEGSVDGSDWVTLKEVTECMHRSNTQWFSTGVTVATGQNCVTSGFGYEVATGMEDPSTIDLSAADAIRVARGATLEIKPVGVATLPKLTLDGTGAGMATVKGFKIAACGVLNLLNEPDGGNYIVPATFADCTDLANLANWDVLIAGVKRARKVRVQDGRLGIYRPGTVFLFR